MLDEKQIEKLTERLISRIQKANEYFLINIGKNIKKIRTLSYTEAQQLVQILKYGDNYEKIIEKISEYSNLDIKEIDEIFKEVAKKNQFYAKNFYEYKNKPFIEYNNNYILKSQVMALSNITKQEMNNFMNTRAIGYSIKDDNGIVRFTGLRETYERVLDEAVLNVSQGKETFDNAMYRILNDIGGSGLKTVDFESGRSVRLDSQLRMNLNGALRNLQNDLQQQFGKEFDSDGVEITVHINPAPDHAEVQGRQFSNEEFNKFQNNEDCVDYKGKIFTAEFEGHDRRSISEYNCYHNIRSIILGISEPIYSDEELQKIIDDNNKGFEIDGKKYTNYEGQQMMRRLESKIREEKDKQILGKASNNEELIQNSQNKINQLTNKYNELTKKSGLLPKKDRLRVSNYKKAKLKKKNKKEIDYAKKNNQIWHSTDNLKEIINSNKIINPSISVGKKINSKVRYGTQFIEFKPKILENVNDNTILYKGDGGNKYIKNKNKFNDLMEILKDEPEIYNELKFNNNIESIDYIKKVYIRQDESKEIIELLKENNIEYEIYTDYRKKYFKKKK